MKHFTGRFFVVMFSVALALTFSGCGGGGGGTGAGISFKPAKSSSFDPITGTDASVAKPAKTSGEPDPRAEAAAASNVPLHWVYMVNDGEPVTANADGVSIRITFSPVEVVIDPADLKRRANLSGPIHAEYNGVELSGNFGTQIEAGLATGAGMSYYRDETMDMSIELSSLTGTARMNLLAHGNYEPPFEWVPDKTNLDTFETGHTWTVGSSMSGDVSISVTGGGNENINIPSTPYAEVWRLEEKIAAMTVRSKNYTNIVRLSRKTLITDLTGNPKAVTIEYWCAKGVGIIKAVGLFQVLDKADVLYELMDTNLSQ